MKKDEILEKSRKENKNEDLFAKQVEIKSGNIGYSVALIAACVFMALQLILKKEPNFGFTAVVLSMITSSRLYKAIKLHGRGEWIITVISGTVALASTVLFAINLFK